jgi:hypothetical protein
MKQMEEILHQLLGGLSHYRVSTIQGGAGFRDFSIIHSKHVLGIIWKIWGQTS